MKTEQQHKDLMRRAVRHLLVTDDDVMNEAERIVGHTLQRENRGDEGCLTVTEIARELDMEARDLNSFLRDMGIQRWKQGQYRLTPQYEGRGLTHDRLFIYYSTKDGKKKRQTYLVWTPKGLEFIRSLIQGCGQARAKSNTFELCRAEAGSIVDQGKGKNFKTTKAI